MLPATDLRTTNSFGTPFLRVCCPRSPIIPDENALKRFSCYVFNLSPERHSTSTRKSEASHFHQYLLNHLSYKTEYLFNHSRVCSDEPSVEVGALHLFIKLFHTSILIKKYSPQIYTDCCQRMFSLELLLLSSAANPLSTCLFQEAWFLSGSTNICNCSNPPFLR